MKLFWRVWVVQFATCRGHTQSHIVSLPDTALRRASRVGDDITCIVMWAVASGKSSVFTFHGCG